MDANCAEMEMEKNKKGLVFVGMELEMVTLKATSTLERRRLSESDSVATSGQRSGDYSLLCKCEAKGSLLLLALGLQLALLLRRGSLGGEGVRRTDDSGVLFSTSGNALESRSNLALAFDWMLGNDAEGGGELLHCSVLGSGGSDSWLGSGSGRGVGVVLSPWRRPRLPRLLLQLRLLLLLLNWFRLDIGADVIENVLGDFSGVPLHSLWINGLGNGRGIAVGGGVVVELGPERVDTEVPLGLAKDEVHVHVASAVAAQSFMVARSPHSLQRLELGSQLLELLLLFEGESGSAAAVNVLLLSADVFNGEAEVVDGVVAGGQLLPNWHRVLVQELLQSVLDLVVLAAVVGEAVEVGFFYGFETPAPDDSVVERSPDDVLVGDHDWAVAVDSNCEGSGEGVLGVLHVVDVAVLYDAVAETETVQ